LEKLFSTKTTPTRSSLPSFFSFYILSHGLLEFSRVRMCQNFKNCKKYEESIPLSLFMESVSNYELNLGPKSRIVWTLA
jgi:hypothetical protein